MASTSARVLIIDDEPNTAAAHKELLESLGHSATILTDPREALTTLERQKFDLVLLDIRMPEIDGLTLLPQIRLHFPQIGVVMATVINDVSHAVRAIKRGAYNYLLKPLQAERLESVIESFFQSQRIYPHADCRFSRFITSDPTMQQMFDKIARFADSDEGVLIQGETGTGKEIIAEIIHHISARKQNPYVAVNIAAITSTLFESELFGHVKGSFTGSIREKTGFVEKVASGTIFLDEIGELHLEQQAKLLRLLQQRTFFKVGSSTESPFRGRFVMATNRNLESEVQAGRFREDFFYRITPHRIVLPPLRDRRGDITVLSNFFLQKYSSQYGRVIDGFSAEALTCLERYPFPGNVRELEGMISAAVLLETSSHITLGVLPDKIKGGRSSGAPFDEKRGVSLSDLNLKRVQDAAIEEALAAAQGNQTKAAEMLGIARGTLNRLLRAPKERGVS